MIEKLEHELKKKLPGTKIQHKMAAGNRVFYKEFIPVGPPKQSSVLIILYLDHSGLNTIFIKRTPDNGPHSGQMAFPGGMHEPEDNSLYETALREAKEEIGFNNKQLRCIGKLTPLHIPVSNIIVNPFIVTINKKPLLKANTNEVEDIFITPVNTFLDKNMISFFQFEYKGKTYKAPSYIMGKYIIWGATAMIWNEFLTIYKRVI